MGGREGREGNGRSRGRRRFEIDLWIICSSIQTLSGLDDVQVPNVGEVQMLAKW